MYQHAKPTVSYVEDDAFAASGLFLQNQHSSQPPTPYCATLRTLRFEASVDLSEEARLGLVGSVSEVRSRRRNRGLYALATAFTFDAAVFQLAPQCLNKSRIVSSPRSKLVMRENTS